MQVSAGHATGIAYDTVTRRSTLATKLASVLILQITWSVLCAMIVELWLIKLQLIPMTQSRLTQGYPMVLKNIVLKVRTCIGSLSKCQLLHWIRKLLRDGLHDCTWCCSDDNLTETQKNMQVDCTSYSMTGTKVG